MFGKRKGIAEQVTDFQCGVCGLHYSNQNSFERHVEWAHSERETSKTESKHVLTESERRS